MENMLYINTQAFDVRYNGSIVSYKHWFIYKDSVFPIMEV